MAKFEVGQKVRIKVGKGSNEEATVNSLPGVGHQSITNYLLDTSEGELLYLESELEPIETFQPGDIVCARKGDEIIQGEVFIDAGDQTLYIDISFGAYVFTLEELEQEGYTLTLVKRPEPEIVLPTKENALVYCRDKIWVLGVDGTWYWAFGNWGRGIESEKLIAWTKRFDDYRVIFEGENE